MYVQEISIELKNSLDSANLYNEFIFLMSLYRRNGQIQGTTESIYIEKDKIVCLPYTHEKESLDEKFNTKHIGEQLSKIEKLCNSEFRFEVIGKSYGDSKTPCKCNESEFYILITDFMTIDSPLKCGTCNKPIPLYKLPIFNDYGYRPIIDWTTYYNSCDILQTNSDDGERWALNQMEDINSVLSKQGFEICNKVEELTTIPTFYYLHNWDKFKGDDLTRHCPKCNERWELKIELHKLYNFKCDRCKIVSTLSPNAK